MNKEARLSVFWKWRGCQIPVLQWRAGKLPCSIFIHRAEKYWCSQKRIKYAFKSVNKMCHIICIWGLGGMRHSNFIDTLTPAVVKKKELHKVYLLCLKILILIKILLLEAYKDKNHLISQSLPTKQRSKFQIFYRKRDTGNIYWCFSAWCFYYYELISYSELLTDWFTELRKWR